MTAPRTSDVHHTIEAAVEPNRLDFHAFFRHRSLALRSLEVAGRLCQESATAIPAEVLPDQRLVQLASSRVAEISDEMVDILMSPVSGAILWNLYCCPYPGYHSALTRLVPSLERIARVIRGGSNVYKLSGWVVHVLVGYGVISQSVPRGEPPTTLPGPRQVREFFANDLRQAYAALDTSSRLILHVAMLGHDIGVAVDILDHDLHGVPLVRQYLAELGIRGNALAAHGYPLSLEDAAWAVETVVRYHTLVNRIGVEFSRNRAKADLGGLVTAAGDNSWRTAFVHQRLATILMLVGTADMIAVDDGLLDEKMVGAIRRGHAMLASVLANQSDREDAVETGFARFIRFAGGQPQAPSRQELEPILQRFGYRPDEFWRRLQHVQELNFALTLLPFLPGAVASLLILLAIFRFIDAHVGTSDEAYESARIVFDHKIRPDVLLPVVDRLLEANDVGSCVAVTGPGAWEIGQLVVHAIAEPQGYAIEVRVQGTTG